MTVAVFLAKWIAGFAYNEYGDLDDATFRDFTRDIASTFGGAVPVVPAYAVGTDYVLSDLVRYTLSGRESFYYALQAGKLPAPTGAPGDPNWKVVPGPIAATALSQHVRLVEAQGIAGPDVVEGRLYAIAGSADPDATSWNGTGGAETIYVHGLQGAFDLEGVLLDAGGKPATRVSVDVVAGSYAPLNVTVDFEHLAGKPEDNPALAAALQALRDVEEALADRLDDGEQAIRQLMADPTTKTYVDAADQQLQAAIAAEKQRMDTLVQNAPQALDTLKEIADQLAADEQGTAAILAKQQQNTQQIAANAQAITALQARGGRFLGPWAAGLVVNPLDYILTPDKSALRYAPAGFTTGSSYDASKWVDLDGVLTVAQVQALAPLTFPVLGRKPGGNVVGFATLAAALAACQNGRVELNQNVTHTGSTVSFTGVLHGHDFTITLADNSQLRLATCGMDAVTITAASSGAAAGLVRVAGGGYGSGGLNVTDATLNAEVQFNQAGGISLYSLSTLANVTAASGGCQVDLYGDDATVTAHSPTVTLYQHPDRDFTPTTSGDGTKFLSDDGTYRVPAGGAPATGYSIDYQHPVVCDENTTALSFGKLHVFDSQASGTHSVSLPDPTGNANKLLYLEILAGTKGLWTFSGSGLSFSLWAGETYPVRVNRSGTGFELLSGNKKPMSCVVTIDGITHSQPGSDNATALSMGDVYELNMPVVVADTSGGLLAYNGGFRIPRSGLWLPSFGGKFNLTSGEIVQIFTKVNGSRQVQNISFGTATSGNGNAFPLFASVPKYFNAGDTIRFAHYANPNTNLAIYSGDEYPNFQPNFCLTEQPS